ncbi:hypothetical protein E2562_038984 [Oryza meyeriana var. granulata]|uniref:Uncharacterized protein n=1 Tax=Oryza meyeriana var. granulata TaxID=110450 RepID=A0A6G1FH06_9ORYZ|nr:hypothetical protein E2562_038984 [Oryza meyeriana var. granulata]
MLPHGHLLPAASSTAPLRRPWGGIDCKPHLAAKAARRAQVSSGEAASVRADGDPPSGAVPNFHRPFGSLHRLQGSHVGLGKSTTGSSAHLLQPLSSPNIHVTGLGKGVAVAALVPGGGGGDFGEQKMRQGLRSSRA